MVPAMDMVVPPTQAHDRHAQAGLLSCMRTIALAVPGQEFTVFKNVAGELAGYVRKGIFGKVDIVDQLQNAARSKGLIERHGQDAVQAAISEAFSDEVPAAEPHDSSGAAAPTQNLKYKLIRFSDLQTNVSRAYLIKGLIPGFGLTVVWGPPKCGKSFFMTDAMLHVALGWNYRGRKVQGGPVVYCAFEGADGYGKRAEAFRKHHKLDPSLRGQRRSVIWRADDTPFLCGVSTLAGSPNENRARHLMAPKTRKGSAGRSAGVRSHTGALRC